MSVLFHRGFRPHGKMVAWLGMHETGRKRCARPPPDKLF